MGTRKSRSAVSGLTSVAAQRFIFRLGLKRTDPMVISRSIQSNSVQGAKPSIYTFARKRSGLIGAPILAARSRTDAILIIEIEFISTGETTATSVKRAGGRETRRGRPPAGCASA